MNTRYIAYSYYEYYNIVERLHRAFTTAEYGAAGVTR